VPIEKIFDAGPGELVVQRCMGSTAGRRGGRLLMPSPNPRYALTHATAQTLTLTPAFALTLTQTTAQAPSLALALTTDPNPNPNQALSSNLSSTLSCASPHAYCSC